MIGATNGRRRKLRGDLIRPQEHICVSALIRWPHKGYRCNKKMTKTNIGFNLPAFECTHACWMTMAKMANKWRMPKWARWQRVAMFCLCVWSKSKARRLAHLKPEFGLSCSNSQPLVAGSASWSRWQHFSNVIFIVCSQNSAESEMARIWARARILAISQWHF